MKKVLSLLLCMCMLVSFSTPVATAKAEEAKPYSVKLGENRMEIAFQEKNESKEFTIVYFEKEEIRQIVSGRVGGDALSVKNYEKGKIRNTESIKISDHIIKKETVIYGNKEEPMRANPGTLIGHMVYNPDFYTNEVIDMKVFSKYLYSDNESYVINADASYTLAMVVGVVATILGYFMGFPEQYELVCDIVLAVGGSIAGGAIGQIVSESVSVRAFHYTMTGQNTNTGEYTSGITGAARKVQTQTSAHYNQWFYEEATPNNWRNDALAYFFWCDLFNSSYPGVDYFYG